MLFRHIRYRLLGSYLAVSTIVLGSFAIAVRIAFIHNLTSSLIHELTTVARSAVTDVEVESERLVVLDDEILVNSDQTIEWFEQSGRLIRRQGNLVITLPFNPQERSQHQTKPIGIQAITVPILDDKTNLVIGYVRVSESTAKLDNTLHLLDWGLSGGVISSLVLSGLGSIWLTRQAMQPIEQNFRQLQQFTADASHEFRSPLMVITSNVEVALKYPDGMRESDIEKFQAIASATHQMSTLTEDLLMLARTDQSLPSKQDAVDVQSVLAEVMQVYSTQAQTQHIDLQMTGVEELWVLGDRVQLMRLFSNLVDNALRYTPAQGTVVIQTKCSGNDGVISVQDTGCGIAPEHLGQVFDRFWQADPSRAYGTGGSGLGLAIAQGITQLHGGTISVTSQVGVGSCFTVRVPLHKPLTPA